MNELRITTINLLFHFTSLERSQDEVTVAIPTKITMEDHMKHLNEVLTADITNLHNEKPCKDSESVLTFDVNAWLNERPEQLLTHLRQLCNLDGSARSNYLLAKMIEQIYNCRNSCLVLPLGFRENLITYNLTMT